MTYPVGATIAGGTRIPEQQSSIGSRPDELVSARSPFVEGRDLQSIDQETLQQPSGLFLAAEQDAADVGGPTPECGTKLFGVGDLIAGAAVDRRELSFHDPSSLLRVVLSFAKTSSESVDDGHSRQAKERPPR